MTDLFPSPPSHSVLGFYITTSLKVQREPLRVYCPNSKKKKNQQWMTSDRQRGRWHQTATPYSVCTGVDTETQRIEQSTHLFTNHSVPVLQCRRGNFRCCLVHLWGGGVQLAPNTEQSFNVTFVEAAGAAVCSIRRVSTLRLNIKVKQSIDLVLKRGSCGSYQSCSKNHKNTCCIINIFTQNHLSNSV